MNGRRHCEGKRVVLDKKRAGESIDGSGKKTYMNHVFDNSSVVGDTHRGHQIHENTTRQRRQGSVIRTPATAGCRECRGCRRVGREGPTPSTGRSGRCGVSGRRCSRCRDGGGMRYGGRRVLVVGRRAGMLRRGMTTSPSAVIETRSGIWRGLRRRPAATIVMGRS